MINEIVTNIIESKKHIENEGIEINGTMEVTGIVLPLIKVHEMNLGLEENEIRDYYNKIGINIQVIRSLEHNLYEFIFRGLKQSVDQLLYFDKTQDFTSRRFVFATTDCISHVQILFRHKKAKLIAHFRSTDIVKLLPWDLLYLCKLINRVLIESEFPETIEKEVLVTIASAHYYLKPPQMY